MSVYEVKLAPAASRTFKDLAPDTRTRIRDALVRLALDVATPGRMGGKTVKSIKGVSDSFHRLRLGDYRVMYDVINEDNVVLVLGITHRGDLERWLRNR